jgi:hypothetical protein
MPIKTRTPTFILLNQVSIASSEDTFIIFLLEIRFPACGDIFIAINYKMINISNM